MVGILSVGIVEFSSDNNMLPVVTGITLVIVGLLGLAALYAESRADFNKADGAGMEGPAPSPYVNELPEWMLPSSWEDEGEWDEVLQSDSCRPPDMPDIEDADGVRTCEGDDECK